MNKYLILLFSILIIGCEQQNAKQKNEYSIDTLAVNVSSSFVIMSKNDKIKEIIYINGDSIQEYNFNEFGLCELQYNRYRNKILYIRNTYSNTFNFVNKKENYFKYNFYNNSLVPIAYFNYDSITNTPTSKSSYTKVLNKKDTLDFGEVFYAHIKDIYNEQNGSFKKQLFFMGGMDENYNIIDTTAIKVISLVNKDEVKIKLNTLTPGNQVFRGFFATYIEQKNNAYQIQTGFVEFKYYVKPKHKVLITWESENLKFLKRKFIEKKG